VIQGVLSIGKFSAAESGRTAAGVAPLAEAREPVTIERMSFLH